MTLEDIEKLLEGHGVKSERINIDKYGFSRTIEFKVYDIVFRIVWFVNESTLKIGAGQRPPQIPFRYMYFDTTFPLVGGNKAIGFYYNKKEKTHLWDSETPYCSFRIPLESHNIK